MLLLSVPVPGHVVAWKAWEDRRMRWWHWWCRLKRRKITSAGKALSKRLATELCLPLVRIKPYIHVQVRRTSVWRSWSQNCTPYILDFVCFTMRWSSSERYIRSWIRLGSPETVRFDVGVHWLNILQEGGFVVCQGSYRHPQDVITIVTRRPFCDAEVALAASVWSVCSCDRLPIPPGRETDICRCMCNAVMRTWEGWSQQEKAIQA